MESKSNETQAVQKEFKDYFITWAKGYFAAIDNYKNTIATVRDLNDAKQTIANHLGLTVEEIEK